MKIRPIETFTDIQQVQAVEKQAWQAEAEEITPIHILVAIARNGGLLLGVFEGQELIGFSLGWLGIKVHPGQRYLPKLISHSTAVLADYRDQGIGYQLKLAQREWALQHGLDLISWTFDPLESRNAYFNLHRLGACCGVYHRNYYGILRDGLNKGLESDRLQADWYILKEGMNRQSDLQNHPILNASIAGPAGFLQPGEDFSIPTQAHHLVEIPSNIQEIRQKDQVLANAWRMHIRAILECVLKRGYEITDFFYQREGNQAHSYYLVEPKHPLG